MSHDSITLRRAVGAALTIGLALASPAIAGPPLLCHPFDIGNARSLPWDGTKAFWQGRADYDVANLVSDTDALLTPSTPVIVRMETLRRAAFYASRDDRVLAELYGRISDRARMAEKAGRKDALAFLDAGVLTEALHEIAQLDGMAEFRGRGPAIRAVIRDAEGYSLVQKSLAARPGDPQIEFAAALVAMESNRQAYLEHAEKAKAAAGRDDLIARNVRQLS
jgi:hypothetical protein